MQLRKSARTALEREYRFAEHLFARGDVQSALPHFRRSSLLDPESFLWRLRIAQCLDRLGQLEEAYGTLKPMIDRGIGAAAEDIRREILLVFTNLCHRINREPEGVECLSGYSDIVDSTPALLYNLGLAHYKGGRMADAGECFERLKTSHPKNSAGFIGLAILHCHAGQFDPALDELRAGRRAAPHDIQIVENLALVQMKMGNPLGAITTLKSARSLPGAIRSAKYEHLLGMAHLRLGELGRAEQYLRQSLSYEKSGDAYRDIGWLMVARGNYVESIAYLKEALALNPNDVWAKVDLAIAYFKQGVPQDALALFAEVRSETQPPEVNKMIDDLARLISYSTTR